MELIFHMPQLGLYRHGKLRACYAMEIPYACQIMSTDWKKFTSWGRPSLSSLLGAAWNRPGKHVWLSTASSVGYYNEKIGSSLRLSTLWTHLYERILLTAEHAFARDQAIRWHTGWWQIEKWERKSSVGRANERTFLADQTHSLFLTLTACSVYERNFFWLVQRTFWILAQFPPECLYYYWMDI